MIEGTKILSFTHFLQGPSAVQILADLGAEVVKVESPKGAFERGWSGCRAYKNGVSVFFMIVDRNQKSLALDLKDPEAKEIIYELIKEYDVVIENFRPGVMNKLGFSYEELSKRNPRLIYCSCSGYGPDGPYHDKAGQDLLAQSLAGIPTLNGPSDYPPFPMGATVIDQHGACLAAMGVLAALFDREKTGKGHRVDACLLNAALDLELEPLGYYMNGGHLSDKTTTGQSSRYHEAPYGVYKTKDKYITVTMNPIERLKKAFDPGVLDGFTYADQTDRKLEFDAIISREMLKKTNAEWSKLFDEAGVWYAEVNDFDTVQEDPQVVHNQMIRTMEHPVAGTIKFVAHPIRYDGEAPAVRCLPPDLGNATEDLLAGIGFDEEKIKDLEARGIAVCHKDK